MGGNGHFDAVPCDDRGEGQAIESGANFDGRQIHAENPANLREPQADGFLFCLIGTGLGESRCELPPCRLEDELGGAEAGAGGKRRIDSALEAIGAFAFHGQESRGLADAKRIESSGFEQDINGFRANFGVDSAHDAGEGDGSLGIGDDQHGRSQFALAAVDADEGLAAPGVADDDLSAVDLGEIKGMKRLTEFHHDVVGDIDDVVDRADADGFEPSRDPEGGCADSDAADQTGRVMGAELGRVDANCAPRRMDRTLWRRLALRGRAN